ncbi:MAG TPA: YceI family protein [Steroidobacteraceae bacterium]|nr:YceI family protein [Steroidobacteraceae bacterium]
MRYARLCHALAATLLAVGALDCARGGAPAAPAAPATAPAAAPAAAHYVLDPAKSSLQFTFVQAGAKNTGHFPRFAVSLDCPGADPAGGRLEVTVNVAALDTGDKDRDDMLRSDDLFAVRKFPEARFSATRIAKTAAGYEADGALTIRGVTRDARVPFTFRTAAEGGAAVAYMAGQTVVRRLDFGVGQGDWKATDQAGNEVTVSFALRLTRAP